MVELAVTLPYWLDRPAEEALAVAATAERTGIGELWIGEMATFEAFALAGALAVSTTIGRLVVGPLPLALRDPVLLAMGIATVTEVGGRPAQLALGASTPTVTAGWHGRSDRPALDRFRDAFTTVRGVLAGARGPGGFRLRVEAGDTTLALAAFGPKMLALAGELADTVVLNLVTTGQLAAARLTIETAARAAGRPTPRVAVWVPVAMDDAGISQLARGLALYVGQPGYGEMFTAAGFGAVVAEARGGTHPKDLVIPEGMVDAIGAVGRTAAAVRGRLDAYGEAGADVVCLAPATAADPGAAALLAAVTSG